MSAGKRRINRVTDAAYTRIVARGENATRQLRRKGLIPIPGPGTKTPFRVYVEAEEEYKLGHPEPNDEDKKVLRYFKEYFESQAYSRRKTMRIKDKPETWEEGVRGTDYTDDEVIPEDEIEGATHALVTLSTDTPAPKRVALEYLIIRGVAVPKTCPCCGKALTEYYKEVSPLQ